MSNSLVWPKPHSNTQQAALLSPSNKPLIKVYWRKTPSFAFIWISLAWTTWIAVSPHLMTQLLCIPFKAVSSVISEGRRTELCHFPVFANNVIIWYGNRAYHYIQIWYLNTLWQTADFYWWFIRFLSAFLFWRYWGNTSHHIFVTRTEPSEPPFFLFFFLDVDKQMSILKKKKTKNRNCQDCQSGEMEARAIEMELKEL